MFVSVYLCVVCLPTHNYIWHITFVSLYWMSLQDKAYYMSLQNKECDFTYNFSNNLITFFILLMYLDLVFIIVVISWQKVVSFSVLVNVKVLPAYNLFQVSTLCQCFHHQNLTTLSENYVNCCVRRKINLCSNHLSWHLGWAPVMKYSGHQQKERARTAGLPLMGLSP